MRAAIDIGSNSIRIAFSDGTTRSIITKLADGIESTGRLSPDGIAKSLEALKSYADECAERGVTDVTAFATEAVRRAADGKEFIAAAARAGINVILLSPRQEAALALAGVDKPDGAVTVCDLGGGSFEVISSPDGVTPDYVKSLPLGVVVLKNRFDGDFTRAINSAPALVGEYGEVPNRPVVISGGSACAIAAAILNLKVYDKAAVTTEFALSDLDDIMPMLMSPRLSVLRPVCAKRADTLPYGAIIIQALLNKLNAVKFRVSDASNLEAVLKGYELNTD